MKTIVKKIVLKEGEKDLRLCLLSDPHVGQRYHDKDKYRKTIDWLDENKEYRVILGGDMIECCTRKYKEDQVMEIDEQIDQIIDDFATMAEEKRIWGIIQGNHEARGIIDAGMNPTHRMAKSLGIANLDVGAVFWMNVKKHDKRRGQNYSLYYKHGSSGATTLTGRNNALLKFRNIVVNADVYAMAHAHTRSHFIMSPYELDRGNATMKVQHFVITGSYLLYEGSYGDRKNYAPSSPSGSARLKLRADTKLITVKE